MDLEALERRIRRLEDLEEIKQLKARYAAYCESHVWTPFGEGWARTRFAQRRTATE